MVVDAVAAVLRDVGPVEGDLPRETDGPDDDSESGDNGKAEVATLATVQVLVVEDKETDHEGTDDGAGTFERGVEGTGGAVENGRVNTSLVRVEVVGREEHGQKSEHAPVLEETEHADDFFVDLGLLLELDDGSIRTDDAIRW